MANGISIKNYDDEMEKRPTYINVYANTSMGGSSTYQCDLTSSHIYWIFAKKKTNYAMCLVGEDYGWALMGTDNIGITFDSTTGVITFPVDTHYSIIEA